MKNQKWQYTEDVTEEDFINPDSKYRGAPFWAWNGKLDQGVMKEQIDTFEKMGFGGFHIHSRIGLDTPYLGEAFMEDVRFCHNYAKEKGMYTYLYDEDKWPSGYGGGQVTKKPEYRARYLLFTPFYHEDGHYNRTEASDCRLTLDGECKLLAVYCVQIEDGRMIHYRKVENKKGTDLWYAYLMVTDKLPWFNEEAYADTLNPEAVKAFIRYGYEPYLRELGEAFSDTVPSIFTDEPQFTKPQCLQSADMRQERSLPYTEAMNELYRQRHGEELLQVLPEIFWEQEEAESGVVRYRFFNLLADLFADSYAGTLGKWCGEHNIMLTGHLMEESGLETQMRSVGDAMRCYRYFQMPGIDMLADAREYTTAKQAQSVARQMGKPGLVSELYGVTNWNFDFRGHKLQGDWQAALGVSVRVPHLAWMYMGGESKRDYPAPIDGHSPWYERYSLIEDYFARLNKVLTAGKPITDICVLHPIESMYLLYGPESDSLRERVRLERQFQALAQWLLFNQLDFDYINEALLPELDVCSVSGSLHVGEMAYRTVVVPDICTVRSTTLTILETFIRAGGQVLVMGDYPARVDGVVSDQGAGVLVQAVKIGFDEYALMDKLEQVRWFEIMDKHGLRRKDLLCQSRRTSDHIWIFAAIGCDNQGKTLSVHPADDGADQIIVKINGSYKAELYDAMTGNIETPVYETRGGDTYIYSELSDHDSLLIRLSQIDAGIPHKKYDDRLTGNQLRQKEVLWEDYLDSETAYDSEEENVLLLDTACWSMDEGEWNREEEILRIDDRVRKQLGWGIRTDSFPQPWLKAYKAISRDTHTLRLKFTIHSECDVAQVKLAFEGDACFAQLNGREIALCSTGFYVDPAIRTYTVTGIHKGMNILECILPFSQSTNLEWFYLLGNFGVRVNGSRKTITNAPEKIGFGDYAVQGYPFYGGNFCYISQVSIPAGMGELEFTAYNGALLGIMVDDKEEIPLFAAPYRISLGELDAGSHTITIRCYGTRINTFGQLHNCNEREIYYGPKTWRTKGRDWCYEYRLHPQGVQSSPILRIFEVK